MKYLFVTLFSLAGIMVQGQDYLKLAQQLQQRYKDDEASVLEHTTVYEFSKGNKAPVKVIVNSNKKLLSLRYNSAIQETEWYDQNSKIEKFYASSSLKQRAGEELKLCASYTSEGLFYDDSKFCSHSLKLKELGEVWDITSVKRIEDAKYLTGMYFQESYPVTTKKVTFIIPVDIEVEVKEFNLAEAQITRQEKTLDGKRIIEYTAKELTGTKRENYDRGDQYTRPHLLVLLKSVTEAGKKTSILATPQDLYSWYSNLTRQLQPNPQVYKATVTQLIQNKKTDEEKIKAIYYWVQDNIRYIAFEDGLAAFKPSEAQDVFEKRFGDCKGMANLTKQMLTTAGYDARLTWIGTRRIMYDQSLPSLAVNNHMICTLFLNGEKYYLDATEKYVPFGEQALRIQGRSVMIEDGSKFILAKIGESENSDADARTLQLSLNGENLEGKTTVVLKGEAKKDFLYRYHYTKSDKRQTYVTEFIAGNTKNAKATDLVLPDLEERSGPLTITASLNYSGAVSSFNNEYYIDIDPSKNFKGWEMKDTRQNDVDLGERIHNSTSIELTIPEGYTLNNLPESLSVTDPEFSFAVSYRQEGNKILYTKTINVPDGVIKKKSFGRWNAAIKKLTQAYENQIVLLKKT